jgi:hypothetical protein
MSSPRTLHLDEKVDKKKIPCDLRGSLPRTNQHPTLLASISTRSPWWHLSRITHTVLIDKTYYL